MEQPAVRPIVGMTREELGTFVAELGEPSYRAGQIAEWLYAKRADSFAAMTSLPAGLRESLQEKATIDPLELLDRQESVDGTIKFLFRTFDGYNVESVMIPSEMRDSRGDRARRTLCISSQVGCAMGCVFCATGQMGYTRHLTTGEIVAQAVHVQRVLRSLAQESGEAIKQSPHAHRLRNIVLMGMGEPLHNYDAVLKAVEILTDGNGLSLGAEHITLSTVGVVPGILRLAKEKKAIRLAVSLHAATQAGRAALVPAARKWQLDELMAACRTYSETTGRRIFYEWTLIEGENDTEQHARDVGNLLRGLPAQVNLIPLNPTTGFEGAPTRSEAAKRFQQILSEEFKIPSTVRQRRGIDIAAGCGQLAIAEK